MKTSKFFVSTLIAAAAMTAPAYAVTSSSTFNYDDSATYSGEIWSITNTSSVTAGLNSMNWTQYISDSDSSSMSPGTAGTGSSYWGKFAAANESASLGNTLRFYTATSSDLVFTADYSRYVWLGGLIVEAGDYGYTFGRTNCYMKLKGNADVGVNMNIAADMKLWADTKIDVETSGAWSIASGKTLTLRSSGGVNLASGVAVTIGGSGTVAIASDENGSAGTISGSGTISLSSGTLANAALSSGVTIAAGSGDDAKNLSGVTFGSGSILDLSGVTLSEDSEIFTATGAVTFSDGVVINLAADSITAGTSYSVLTASDGGSITGWTSDNLTFVLGGTTLSSVRNEITVSDGAFTIGNLGGVIYSDLVWSASQTEWNNTDTDGAWARSSDSTGAAYSFFDGDSVTFNTSGASVTVEGTVKPNAMTVSANTTLTGTDATVVVESPDKLIISENVTLNIGAGVTLDVGSTDTATTLSVSGEGTIKLANAGGHGKATTIASEFSGTLDYSGDLGLAGFSIGDDVKLRISALASGNSMWSDTGNTQVLANDITFATDYQINVGGDSITFNGKVSVDGDKTLDIRKGWPNNSNSLTLAGTSTLYSLTFTNSGILNISGEATISGSVSGTGTLNVNDGGDLTITGNGSSSTQIQTTINVLAGGTAKFTGHDLMGWSASSDVVAALTGSDAKKATLYLNDTGNLTFTSVIKMNGNAVVTADSSANVLNTFGGKFVATGTNNTISDVQIQLRNAFDVEVTGASDTLEISSVIASHGEGTGGLTKTGLGKLILSGENTFSTGAGGSTRVLTVSAGTLVAANASALGKGQVSVAADAKLGLVAGTTVKDVTGGIALSDGAKLVIDLSSKVDATETFTLDLITGTTITFGDVAMVSDSSLVASDWYELSGWENEGWTSALNYENNTLTLTMTIPEPSAFGLLAGVGALALVASRRRRNRR